MNPVATPRNRCARYQRMRGSALLQAALVYGSLLFVGGAILDIAHYLFVHRTLSERARNAARYGVTHGFDEAAMKNMVLYENPIAPQGARPVFGLEPQAVLAALETGADGSSARWLTIRVRSRLASRFLPRPAGEQTAPQILVMLPMETP
jgi:hypothetical protein